MKLRSSDTHETLPGRVSIAAKPINVTAKVRKSKPSAKGKTTTKSKKQKTSAAAKPHVPRPKSKRAKSKKHWAPAVAPPPVKRAGSQRTNSTAFVSIRPIPTSTAWLIQLLIFIFGDTFQSKRRRKSMWEVWYNCVASGS